MACHVSRFDGSLTVSDRNAFGAAGRQVAALLLGVSLAFLSACGEAGQTTDVSAEASHASAGDVCVSDEVSAVKVVSTEGDDVAEDVAGSVSNENTGSIKDPEDFVIALNLQSQGRGSVAARIAGDVSVRSTAQDALAKAVGVFMREGTEGEGTRIAAEVAEDVFVQATGPSRGISAIGFNRGSDFSANVGGKVRVRSKGVAPAGVYDAVGVESQAAEGGSSTVSVGGGIEVSDEREDTGVYGIETYGDTDSETSVHIAGGISATGGGEVVGARLSCRSATTTLGVDGDVLARSGVGDAYGAVLEARDGAEIELVVTGSVEGDASALMFQGDGTGTYDVCVYKAVCEEGGNLFSLSELSDESLDEIASSVGYLIRVRQPEVGGSVRLVDGEGNELETRFGQPVAHAGDKVYVEVDLEEGYRVSGLFVGEDDLTELASDEGGNYLIVPEGGGVTVSVSLEG